MSQGFPKLEEAMVGLFHIKPAVPIGQVNTGAGLNFIRVTGGSVKTVEGFLGPKFEGTVVDGEDWVTVDNDGKRLRLNAKMLIKADDGAVAVFSYIGIITVTPEIGLILSGNEARKTVPFGNIVSSGQFETGDPRYKDFENNLFVGSGRFRVNDDNDRSVTVEYGLSRLIAA
ncbi:hypothetical protein EV426DRAFT_573068 [Tirmania nivea]|nr:hypothetical protein EV426DRAFT_573068 [Tirmania nivea]